MESERRSISLRDIFYVFFKNKIIISLIFLVALISASIYCIVAPPKYRAEAKILIRMGKAQISGMEQYSPDQKFNMLFSERTQNIRNEMELLKGEYITEKVLTKLKPQIDSMDVKKSFVSRIKDSIRPILQQVGVLKKRSDSVDKGTVILFMNSLGVTYLEDTDMIRVTFDWTEPRFAALVVNTYADEYVTQHAQVYDSQRSYRFYIDQIELYEKKLRDAENELQDFTSKSNLSNIELQKELLLKTIADLNNRYGLVSIDHAQALTRHKMIQDMYKSPGMWIETPTDMGNTLQDKQAYLRTLDDAYFKLKVEKERLLKSYMPASAEIKAMDAQLNNLRKQKAESLTNIVNVDLAMTGNKKSSLQREIVAETQKLDMINSKTLSLRQLQRTREIAETTYQAYKKKAEELRISDDLDSRKISSVKVAVPAMPPLQPAYPKKGLIIAVTAFIGLILGFGFAAVREFFNHTFKDEESVSAYLDVPLLMSVSLYQTAGDSSFFSNLKLGRSAMVGRGRTDTKKPAPFPGSLSVHNANNLLLAFLSVTTFCFSGYSIYARYYAAGFVNVSGGENRIEETENFLAQGPIFQTRKTVSDGGASELQALYDTRTVQTEAGHQKQKSSDNGGMPLLTERAWSKTTGKPAVSSEALVATSAADTLLPAKRGNQMPVREHIVSSGETLVSILRNVYHVPDEFIFNESIELFKAANRHVGNYRNLSTGQRINIPIEIIEKGRVNANLKG